MNLPQQNDQPDFDNLIKKAKEMFSQANDNNGMPSNVWQQVSFVYPDGPNYGLSAIKVPQTGVLWIEWEPGNQSPSGSYPSTVMYYQQSDGSTTSIPASQPTSFAAQPGDFIFAGIGSFDPAKSSSGQINLQYGYSSTN